MKQKSKLNYISLFSSAGVGCYGFKLEGFDCIATNEIIERRLQVQRNNKKCKYESGYLSGDIRDEDTKQKIYKEIEFWEKKENINDVDVLLATPPCQGISVANHKKKNEQGRNSLIIESIKLTKEIQPKFFVFENVRSFLNTTCTDIDGKDKKISEAIELNLGGMYNILSKVINFKEYGSNSSRTRTLVVGTRKDLLDITPYDLFPKKKSERTLRQVIGNLPELKKMGEFSKDDFYHQFRKYSEHMLDWINDIKEGESAFDNKDPQKKPHRIVDGKIIYNRKKNGDKYTRCFWDKIAPCIHTRNDIFASQSTIHPKDNRVLSIRELMLLMTIPENFRWTDKELEELNSLSIEEKNKILFKEEMNIRQSIGEAVPTEIFRQIAEKIKKSTCYKKITISEINQIVKDNKLDIVENLKNYIKFNKNQLSMPELLKIIELSNAKRQDHAAYYTRQDICYSLINELPAADNFKELNILEPSVGAGNFLPLLIEKYREVDKVIIDVVDIDDNAINILKALLSAINIPKNISINIINDDFLVREFNKKYDIVIGNPPFGKIVKSKDLLSSYKKLAYNFKTNNIFSFFVEKAVTLGNYVALISPKSLLSAPDFNLTREFLSRYNFKSIIDYGEKAFGGVKIETISIVLNNNKNINERIKTISYINNSINFLRQNYVFDSKLPVWIIYRNNFFDQIFNKLKVDIFNVFRDRVITKSHTKPTGEIRVLKSRNIENNKVTNIDGYDSYLNSDDIIKFPVSAFINRRNVVLVPNLTYNPRACFMPQNSIADGSVALLTPKNGDHITMNDLEYYATEEFKKYYMIAKNLGTRSLNIDSNFVYFFGIKR